MVIQNEIKETTKAIFKFISRLSFYIQFEIKFYVLAKVSVFCKEKFWSLVSQQA